jgi:deazaflavin-dependent oxidoreductase (nitroreductase family)
MPAFTVPDNVADWIRDHTQRYLDTNGEDGHMWDRPGGGGILPTLLLVTTGRKSGNEITLPLIYGEKDGAYIIVASKGGAPAHPAWYLNLDANPDVQIQVGADRCHATARTATGDERSALWTQMAELFSPYTEYQARAVDHREIPVVVLDPVQ